MDSFEVNKVLGAVLGTCLFAFGTGFLAELIYHPTPAGNAGYPLPGGGAEGGHGEGESAKKDEKKEGGVATLLASADPEKGKGGTKACQACHSFEKGGPNKIGPDLWDVVERKKGSHEGFDYSAGLKEKGGTWTYDDLDKFLTKPGEYIKGTKMAFGGIGSPQDRANVIAYLRTLSESPKPLPEAGKTEEPKKDEAKKDEAEKDQAKKDDKAAEGGKKAEEAKEDGKKDDGKKAEGGDPFVAKVASADPAKGKDGTKACQACHSFDKGGPNKVGPDLWGVVGRKKGSHEGYSYSDGMKAKGGEWTLSDLNQFLTKPADYVKGTKMGFPGIAKEDERAAVIAYLHTLADNPQPLAGAEKKDEGKKDEGKKAEGEKAEGEKAEGEKAEGEKKPEEAKEPPKDQAKPAEKKSESKPEEAKPAEAKPADGDAAEKSSASEAPAATEPATKPNEGAEKKADDEKPAEDKPKE